MYRGAVVNGFVNISVYLNKLANNILNCSIVFFKNLRFLILLIVSYDLYVSRLLIYCEAVKQ